MKFSKIQLGTVQFGLDYGVANSRGKPSYETARDIIARACESGVNTLDTAAVYGDSEEVIGRALSELKLRENIQIVSKVPPVSLHNLSAVEAEKFITESVENSLRKLRRDYLHVCLFHREEDLKYLDILRKLESRGLIMGCGVSLDSTEYCAETLKKKVEYVQLPYNILDKRYDGFLVETAVENVKIFTRSLYLQGLLMMPEERIRTNLRVVIPIRRKLNELAMSTGISLPELCARFVISNPAVTSILTGVDTRSQLDENITLMSLGPLPDDICKQVKAIVPVLPETIIRPSLWNTV